LLSTLLLIDNFYIAIDNKNSNAILPNLNINLTFQMSPYNIKPVFVVYELVYKYLLKPTFSEGIKT